MIIQRYLNSLVIFSLISCASINNFDKMDNNVTMSMEIKGCINTNLANEVLLSITNNSDKSFWLRTWDVYIYQIINEEGNSITPVKLIEKIAPLDIDEYVLIKANAKFKTSFSVFDFEAFNLKAKSKYKVIFKYDSQLNKKNTSTQTLLLELTSNPVVFKTCSN